MKTVLRDLLNKSGKRSAVDYDKSIKRVKRHESLAQKKMNLINSVIGDQADVVIKALAK